MTAQKTIQKCIAMILVLILGNFTICFSMAETQADMELGAEMASETEMESEEAPVVKTIAGLDFTGPVIELTLDQALSAALTSGSAIEEAEIKKQTDALNAKSNEESLSKMDSANQDQRIYGKSELERTRKAQEYYKTIAERNYEAAKNQITYNITNSYYSMLHGEENVRIAEESLKLQESLLDITKLKYANGIVANQEVLQMEVNVNNARAEVASAELTLAEKKMVFNGDLGYAVMQDVHLTSELSSIEPLTIPLEEAVLEALTNRNELYTGAYNLTKAESDLESYKGYPNGSAVVLKAKNAIVSAQKSYGDTENSIQREVRLNYASMMNNQSQIANAELSAKKSKESLEIYIAKYELGMSTLSDVQQAQIDFSKAEKNCADILLRCNLSILEYRQSITVGRNIN